MMKTQTESEKAGKRESGKVRSWRRWVGCWSLVLSLSSFLAFGLIPGAVAQNGHYFPNRLYGDGGGLTNMSAAVVGPISSIPHNSNGVMQGSASLLYTNGAVVSGGFVSDGNSINRVIHPPTVTASPASSVVISNANYNAFPGLALLPGGRLLCVFSGGVSHAADDRSLYSTISSNRGVTWTTPALIYDNAEPTKSVADSAVVLLSDGTLLLSSTLQHGAATAGGTNTAIVFKGYPTNANGSITWSAPITVSNGFAVYSFAPSPVIELTNGVIWLPIYGYNGGAENTSVAVVPSYDKGLTWSNMVYVAQGVAPNGWSETEGVQFDNGKVLLMLRRDDGGLGYDAAWSSDGCMTWTDPIINQKITTTPVGRPTVCRLVNGGTMLIARAISGQTYVSTSWDEGTNWTSLKVWPNPASTSDYDVYSAAIQEPGGGIYSVISSAPDSGMSVEPAWIRFQEWYDAYGFYGASAGALSKAVITDVASIGTNLTVGKAATVGYSSAPASGLTVLGSVSIGTTNPLSKLHVLDATQAGQIRADGSVSQGGGIELYNSLAGATRRNWGMYTEQYDAGDMAIMVSAAAGISPGTLVMKFASDGKVGISTTVPTAKLEVSAPASSYALRVNTNALVVTNGNVGIGTAVPSVALDVVGEGRFIHAKLTNEVLFYPATNLGSAYRISLGYLSGADATTSGTNFGFYNKFTDTLSFWNPNPASNNWTMAGTLTASNVYAVGDVSALTLTDRSSAPDSLADAYAIVGSIKAIRGRVDHSKLHPKAWGTTGGVPDPAKRDLSMVVSAQSLVIADLVVRIDSLERMRTRIWVFVGLVAVGFVVIWLRMPKRALQ